MSDNTRLGRVVARGKRGTKLEGEYINLGTMWTQFDDAHSLSLENRVQVDGNWDSLKVRLLVTMPDGSEVEVTGEDFFINYKPDALKDNDF